MPRTDHTWTDERRELAVKLYRDGLSASQIAKKLGGVSRNAVIGMVGRMRAKLEGTKPLPSRSSVQARSNLSRKASLPRPKIKVSSNARNTYVEAERVPLPPQKPRGDHAGVELCDLPPHGCKWPVTAHDAALHLFCAEVADGELPYCPEHAALAWQPGTRRPLRVQPIWDKTIVRAPGR